MFKNFSGYMLVSDLDGTLLTHENYINPKNIDRIRRFIFMGGYFTIATGRTMESLQPYVEQLKINVPAVTSNGAFVYDYKTNKMLKSHFLPDSSFEIVEDVLLNYKNIGIEIMTQDCMYILNANEYTSFHRKRKDLKNKLSDLHSIKDRWIKAIFCQENAVLKKLEIYLENKYKDANLIRSGDFYYEIIPTGINKSTGIAFLQNLLNIKKENIFAIGDYYNDVAMLQYASVSAATYDAFDDIKKSADMVLGKCEDGVVAEFIDYLIENHGG